MQRHVLSLILMATLGGALGCGETAGGGSANGGPATPCIGGHKIFEGSYSLTVVSVISPPAQAAFDMPAVYSLTYAGTGIVTIKATKLGDLVWSPMMVPSGSTPSVGCGENPLEGPWVSFNGSPNIRIVRPPGSMDIQVTVGFSAPVGGGVGVGGVTLTGARSQ
jgi:hypothetical protein